MDIVNDTLPVAKGISEYGIMIIICAVFLILSSGLMIACFRWFKTVMENIMNDYSERLSDLQETANKSTGAMIDIAEGLIPETQLRIKNISGVLYLICQRYKLESKLQRDEHGQQESIDSCGRILDRNFVSIRNAFTKVLISKHLLYYSTDKSSLPILWIPSTIRSCCFLLGVFRLLA